MSNTIRLCVLGSKDSGKTCLIERFIKGEFSFKIKKSENENLQQKKFQVDSKDCNLEILDISSNFLTPDLFEKWISVSNGIVILYSVASSESFEVCEALKNVIKDRATILVGSQADKESQREVTKEQGKNLSNKLKSPFLEVSSKTGENVEIVFTQIVQEIWKRNNKLLLKKVKGRLDYQNVPVIGPNSSLKNMLSFNQTNEWKIEWEKKPTISKQWSEVEPLNLESIEDCLIEKSCKSKGYFLELGRNEFSGEDEGIENLDDDYPYYKNDLSCKEHLNYMGEIDPIGPIIISVESRSSTSHRKKAIIRTKYGFDRMYVPKDCVSSKEILKYIKSNHPKLQSLPKGSYKSLQSISDSKLPQDLIRMEDKEITKHYKIGLLYVKDGQKLEDEMFSNVVMSQEFEGFLHFIGKVIDLQGHPFYAGGLDVKTNSTGKKSVWTKHYDVEIMFHVSTLLPYQPEDKQRVERKRHIGNDMVVLIFKEGNQPFDPCALTSQFNHVFIVVQQCETKTSNSNTTYRISIANKPGVKPYGPFLPYPAEFKKNSDFREFLLSKLVNGQRGAMFSNEFKAKIVSTRRIQLEELVKNYISQKGRQASQIKSPVIIRKKPLEKQKVEDIVLLGKKIFQSTSSSDPNVFDVDLFKFYLQEILRWSVENENIVFQKQKKQDDFLILAKNLFKSGNSFS